jgi:hypothetical protein
MLATQTQTLEETLTTTLGKLEKRLLAPPVPGELAQWTHTVQEAAATLAVELTSYLRTVLHVQYGEIAKTDPEMSRQVEKLLCGDRQLLAQLTQFHELLHSLAVSAEHVNKDEGKLASLQQQVEATGIALVLSIKKQQAAAATWLSEAHFRDRGVAD